MSQIVSDAYPSPLSPAHWPRLVTAAIGKWTLARLDALTYLAGALCGLLWLALHPRTWTPAVRGVLVRQILFTGVESIGFVCFIAVLTGGSVVLQARVWLTKYGLSDQTGPLLVTIVIRELAPLVVNFVILSRSGYAITTEIGQMKLHGEIRALEMQGVDPGAYLVLPRVLGMAVSIFCLTVFFSVASLASGWLFSALLQGGTAGSGEYLDSVTRAIGPAEVWNLLAKTLVPALIIGIITCTEGLHVGKSPTDVPQAASRAIKRSVIWVFLILALVSANTYL
jgi:phospholipid/cholesterol/gamma-HCH transport system permease protein